MAQTIQADRFRSIVSLGKIVTLHRTFAVHIKLGVRMHTVSLSLNADDCSLVERIEATLEDEEVELLRQFMSKMDRLGRASLLKRGMPSISRMSLIGGPGPAFTCDPYQDSELYELLHLLRPIVLSREPTSYKRITGVLGKRFLSETFRAYLKAWRITFENGELKLYMQITMNGRPLFDDSTLKLWLNGTEYHQDSEKAEQWQSFAKLLTEANTRAFVITQLHSKVKAAFVVAHVVHLILQEVDGRADA
jgi:hypothetical protein